MKRTIAIIVSILLSNMAMARTIQFSAQNATRSPVAVAWYQGEDIHQTVSDASLSNSHAVIWDVVSATNYTLSYIITTGTVVSATNAIFAVSPSNSNLAAGDYIGFVRIINIDAQNAITAQTIIARQTIRVLPASDTRNTSYQGPLTQCLIETDPLSIHTNQIGSGLALIGGYLSTTGTPVGAESDPTWTGASNLYYTKTSANALFATGTPLYAYTESDLTFATWLETNAYVKAEADPVWSGASNLYHTKTSANALFATGTPLYAFTEGDPRALPLYSPRSCNIPDPCETVHWNPDTASLLKGSAGYMSNDLAFFSRGTQSVELVTYGDGVAVVAKAVSLTPFSMTGRYFKVLVAAMGVTNSSHIRLYASSDNGTNYIYWNLKNYFLPGPTLAQEKTWLPVTLPWGDGVVVGTLNRSAINWLQFRIADDNKGNRVTGWCGGVTSIAEPQKAIVSITFDDGWLSQYTMAKPVLDAAGFKATAYVIPSLAGTSNYMTISNMDTLQLLGWDISAHDMPDYSTLAYTDLVERCISVKSWLVTNGFGKGSDDFAYPNGAYNSTVLSVVRRFFRSARSIVEYAGAGVGAETCPPADYHRLRIASVRNTATPSSIENLTQNAISNKAWLILMFHQIVTNASVSTEYSLDNFRSVVSNLAASGVDVRTVSDVLTR